MASELRVEAFLNFAWMSLAAVLVCLWFRYRDEDNSSRRRQIVAIVILVAILFPVISVSDDLFAIQNAAEVDNCQRRDHLVPSNAHPVLPVIAAVLTSLHSALSLGFLQYVAPRNLPLYAVDQPDLAAIQNRPPPMA